MSEYRGMEVGDVVQLKTLTGPDMVIEDIQVTNVRNMLEQRDIQVFHAMCVWFEEMEVVVGEGDEKTSSTKWEKRSEVFRIECLTEPSEDD